MAFKVPEKFRVTTGLMASGKSFGNNGAFVLPHPDIDGIQVFTIASDGRGWEHVSVSLKGENRCPTWEEMCFIKDRFWSQSDCVIQFHPPHDTYVNNHNYCLHLWRHTKRSIPIPATLLVGIK